MSKILYFWEFDVDPQQRQSFNTDITGWTSINAHLPQGVAIQGIYEVFVGHGIGPRYQVMMVADDLAAIDGAEKSAGLADLHARVQKYVVPGTVRNRLLRSL